MREERLKSLSPSPREGRGPGADGTEGEKGRGEGKHVCAILLCLAALPAYAHKGSDAYWTLRASGAVVSGRVDVALKDLEVLVGLDADGDGKLTWGEVKAKDAVLRTALIGALALAQSATPPAVGSPSPRPFSPSVPSAPGPRPSRGEGDTDTCPLELGAFNVVSHSDGMYLSVPVTARCPAAVSELEVKYALLFDVDAQHRGLLSVSGETGGNWTAFTNNRRTQTLTFTSIGAGEQTGLAFLQGVHHIAIGWDHLCFLFALLLPSVLRRAGTDWVPRPAFKPTLLDVTKVVTAFTVAHSLTLALAAFGVVTPNAQWVEVAIAVSVALAAFNNLVPFVPETRWSLAFSLGLMHGFGFVSAIRDLGAAGPSLWLSVLGFNLGVEAGQLGIVAVFVPLAWLLRAKPAYRSVLMPLGSAVILGVAMWWTAQRL